MRNDSNQVVKEVHIAYWGNLKSYRRVNIREQFDASRLTQSHHKSRNQHMTWVHAQRMLMACDAIYQWYIRAPHEHMFCFNKHTYTRVCIIDIILVACFFSYYRSCTTMARNWVPSMEISSLHGSYIVKKGVIEAKYRQKMFRQFIFLQNFFAFNDLIIIIMLINYNL